MLKGSILILLLASCALADTIAWRDAVLRERDETIKCIKDVCDNTMTVDHCLDLVEALCL